MSTFSSLYSYHFHFIIFISIPVPWILFFFSFSRHFNLCLSLILKEWEKVCVQAHNSLFDEDEDQTLVCKYLVSHAENENGSRVLLNKRAKRQFLSHNCLERLWVRTVSPVVLPMLLFYLSRMDILAFTEMQRAI